MSFAESIINANQLNEAVKGKKIVNVIVNQNPHKFVWFALEPSFLNLVGGIKLGKRKTVKDLLATRNHVPGIDNSILHEILWEAQVHPKTLIINLQEEDYIRIYDSIKKVFSAVISGGGKDTDKDLYGNYGTYITHASKNTLDKPCVRCGVPIEKDIFLGGAIYYCSKCQPKKNQ